MKRNKVVIKKGQENRRKFVELFESLCDKHSGWQIWQDFIYMASAALAQPCDFRQTREDEYLRIVNKYSKEEQSKFPQMLEVIVEAFEEEKFADILGDLYMQLGMGNKWHRQFFTPYHVCVMMSKMNATGCVGEIEEKGYISVADLCCGGGAMLISFAQVMHEENINYQNSVVFVAQDIDPVVARMCYIQLSLLGCPGYVVIGNSLTQPVCGHVLFPHVGKVNEDSPDADIWYTPMWFTEAWSFRRAWHQTSQLIKTCMSDTPLTEATDGVITLDETAKTATYQQLGLEADYNPDEINELDG